MYADQIRMARNEEKHFCNLNRLILLKEKEEYEKIYPPRPKLSTLDTPEDIQKWLPSIKRDIDFYLKKSQVVCYSDAHVEECKEKVVKLEKEFKAFVRKIKKLAPSPTDVIPWTSRPYKRKKTSTTEETSFKEFKRIATPILDDKSNNCISAPNEGSVTPPKLYTEENDSHSFLKMDNVSQYDKVNWNLMDQPLIFCTATVNQKKPQEPPETNVNLNISNLGMKGYHLESSVSSQNRTVESIVRMERPLVTEKNLYQEAKQTDFVHKIVNYDTSDDETS